MSRQYRIMGRAHRRFEGSNRPEEPSTQPVFITILVNYMKENNYKNSGDDSAECSVLNVIIARSARK